jgi:hypothetical protein
VIGYASVCNGRNLDALVAAGWGILFAPYALDKFGPQLRRFEKDPPAPYCLDNGAWSQAGGDVFDPFRFMQLVGILGRSAEFVVLPDIVCGGHDSLSRSLKWLRALRGTVRRVLIPVQNGIEPADVAPFLAPDVGVFVGGDTPYKLATLGTWGDVCRPNPRQGFGGYYLHVGRVNTQTRIRLCGDAGAASYDGTGATVFGCKLPGLEAARSRAVEQRALFVR